MLVALHKTLAALLGGESPSDSLLKQAAIDFAVPSSEFRAGLNGLTLNLHLHEVRENLEMRRAGTMVRRGADGSRASRVRAPALVDCGYCITAWSPAEHDSGRAFEEHGLLSEALMLLLKHDRIPESHWDDGIGQQMAPYPTVVAQPDALKNPAEFWTALGHPPKPVLTYVVTMAVPLHDPTADVGAVVGPDMGAVQVDLHNRRPEGV